MRPLHLGIAVTLAALAGVAGCSASPSSSGPTVEAAAPADAAPATPIDAALARAWKARGLTPRPLVDDATYLRRASIDLVGRIPTVEEARAFAADAGADKRARAVDRLLASPEHDRHLARRWEAILLGGEVRQRVIDQAAFRRFLERRFQENVGWDALVREIVTAKGKTSLGGAMRPGAALMDDPSRGQEESGADVNAAANYFVRFARSPQDLAGTTSRAFLGVQIQCAQCHDHKTESWKQADFQAFASSLARVKIGAVDRERGMQAIFEVEDARRVPPRLLRDEEVRAIADATPRALDGTDLSGAGDTRQALAAWMTSKQNPWFSRAIANRVWAELFGAGLVEPVDDLREKNPPIVPEALDLLAEGFEESGFDLDYLYRTLARTDAYARAGAEGDATPRDALFSRSALRPIGSDVLLDSFFVAADVQHLLEERAPERAELLKAMLRRRLRFVFESDTESNDASFDGTLQQALFSMNGILPIAATTVARGTVLERLTSMDDATAIEELWLRAFSRPPTAEEEAAAKEFLAAPHPAAEDDGPVSPGDGGKRRGKGARKDKTGAGVSRMVPASALRSRADDDRERAYEDLFWTLLNASEFHFRR